MWSKIENKTKADLKNILLCALQAIMLVLVIGLFFSFLISLIRDFSTGMRLALSKDLLTPFIAAVVGAIALLAFFRDRDKIEFEKNENASKILYDQSKEALEHAFETLKLLPQDRIEWIHASKSIIYSDILGKKIISQNYRIAYKSLRNKYQEKIRKIFRENGECIPAAFFFGHKQWKNKELDLRDVQEETKSKTQIFGVRPFKNDTIPIYDNRNFDLETVVVIMCFLIDEDYFKDKDKDKDIIKKDELLNLVDIKKYEKWHHFQPTVFGAYLYIDMQINPPPKEGSGGVEITTLPRSSLPPDCLPDQPKHLVND